MTGDPLPPLSLSPEQDVAPEADVSLKQLVFAALAARLSRPTVVSGVDPKTLEPAKFGDPSDCLRREGTEAQPGGIADAAETRLDRRARRKQAAALRDASFDWLADGFTHQEIAKARKVSVAEVRRDIAKAIRTRQAETREGHAQLQIARLMKGLSIVTARVQRGELAAIGPLVKVVTALDRYQGGAAAPTTSPPAALAPEAPVQALPAPPLALSYAAPLPVADLPDASLSCEPVAAGSLRVEEAF